MGRRVNQTIETDPKIAQMIDLVDKDIKTPIKNKFHMLKKVEESMNMIRRDKEDIKKPKSNFQK